MTRLLAVRIPVPFWVIAVSVAVVAVQGWALDRVEPAAAESPIFEAIRGQSDTQRTALPAWLPAGVLQHDAAIYQAADDVSIDPLALALLVSIECPTGNPSCTSHAGARGLGQVMPATAQVIEDATGWPCTSDPFDPLTSLRCGGWYYLERLRGAASAWAPHDEAPALGVAGIGYHDGPFSVGYAAAREVARAGGDPCAAAGVSAQGRAWCRQMVSGWRRAR